MKQFARVLLLLLIIAPVAGCGGGGGDGDDTTTAPGDLPPNAPAPDGPMVDNQSLYTHPGNDLLEMYVTIWPDDNPETEEDRDCPFLVQDGVGTTLADVHQDLDPDDNCNPELDVVVEMAGLRDSAGAVNADLRIRGATSRYAPQKSYRIQFKRDPGDLWRGQRTLFLQKHPWDLSRLRSKLSFDLMIDIPHITSLRTQFTRLWVDQKDGNGFVDFGMYTLTEKPGSHFLVDHGLDPNGTLYKAEFFEWERYAHALKLESDPTYDRDLFEMFLDIKEGDGNHAPLLEMLDAVNDESNDFSQVFATYFNQDNYLTWLACNLLFDNTDTNAQNFFLYRHSAGRKFYFLPWDYDGAWDFYGQPIQQANSGESRWQEGLGNWWVGKLHQRFFKQPGAVDLLTARLQQIKSTYVTEARVDALLTSYLATARPRIEAAPDVFYVPALDNATIPAIMAEWDAEIARIPALIEAKYQEYLDTLERPMPVYMGSSVGATDVFFFWDESFDLQGDGITYDFQLATTPTFEPANLVTQGLGLTDTDFQVPLAVLPAGTYYYRVVMRDTKAPSTNWQLAFDSYYDAGSDTVHHGVIQLVIP